MKARIGGLPGPAGSLVACCGGRPSWPRPQRLPGCVCMPRTEERDPHGRGRLSFMGGVGTSRFAFGDRTILPIFARALACSEAPGRVSYLESPRDGHGRALRYGMVCSVAQYNYLTNRSPPLSLASEPPHTSWTSMLEPRFPDGGCWVGSRGWEVSFFCCGGVGRRGQPLRAGWSHSPHCGNCGGGWLSW